MKSDSILKSLSSQDKIVKIAKISLIVFAGIFLIGNFNPYFEGADSYSYALTAKQLSQGNLFYTNDFIESGELEFIPHDVIITKDGKNALPAGYAGFFGLVTLSYILAGNYGLFYLGPILGIFFLIISERISTNLFGKYVGLLTLLFLTTNHLFYRASLNLQTETVFSIFFILGCYFLIKFFKTNNNKFILVCSTFFVISALMRINGSIYFPIELGLLLGVLIIKNTQFRIYLQRINLNFKIFKTFSTVNNKSTGIIFILSLLPWIAFLIFYFSYFGYFFGDPFTNHVLIAQGEAYSDVQSTSLFNFDLKNIENFKEYSKYLLPYQFPRIVDTTNIFSDVDNILGKNWLGVISISIWGFFLFYFLYTKNHRISMIIFSTMIVGTIWFFSALTGEERSLRGPLPARYMLPTFALSCMVLSLMIINFLQFKKPINYKIKFSLKSLSVIILAIFFVVAFNFSPPVQTINDNNFVFKNPADYDKRYPLDPEGLSKNDILISVGFEAIDYGFIQFKPYIEDEKIAPRTLDLLKNTISDGHDFYTMKKPFEWKDKLVYKNLAEHPNFILSDFSNSFCKVEFVSESNNSNELKNNLNCLDF